MSNIQNLKICAFTTVVFKPFLQYAGWFFIGQLQKQQNKEFLLDEDFICMNKAVLREQSCKSEFHWNKKQQKERKPK